MQSARQDLIHMAASRKKHRGEATCEEQARPNNDDEPSNHVGLCYDTVYGKYTAGYLSTSCRFVLSQGGPSMKRAEISVR